MTSFYPNTGQAEIAIGNQESHKRKSRNVSSMLPKGKPQIWQVSLPETPRSSDSAR